jgi:hypothetical protein
MPYFVYQVFPQPIRRLTKVSQHAMYKDAVANARQRRSELPADAPYFIKMIFADNELHAEDLLNQVRESIPNPDDD